MLDKGFKTEKKIVYCFVLKQNSLVYNNIIQKRDEIIYIVTSLVCLAVFHLSKYDEQLKK